MPRRSGSPAPVKRLPSPGRAEGDVRFNYSPSYGNQEPFSTPHTVTMLLVLLLFIIYAAFWTKIEGGEQNNIRNGIFAALAVGLIFCAEHLRDTLFIRPHPAVWRFVTGIGLFYTMFCTYLLFQSAHDIRTKILPELDSGVTGEPPAHRSYGDSCALTWPNVKDALLDEFVIAHFVGWIFKHMMLRDIKLSMILSVLFELMEYTFEFLQPNFAECWWDHWILDFAVCNTGGIIVGELLLQYFSSKNYDWAGFSEISTVKGKLMRTLQQFTPHSWTPYNWHVLRDFRRFCSVLILCVGAMVIELDAFFLKDIFWVKPPVKLNVYRLLVWWAVGMVGLRDYYAFMTDRKIKRLGSTAWTMLAMMIVEFLVVIKFGKELYKDRPMPAYIAWSWAIAGAAFVAWMVYWFALRQAPTGAVEPHIIPLSQVAAPHSRENGRGVDASEEGDDDDASASESEEEEEEEEYSDEEEEDGVAETDGNGAGVSSASESEEEDVVEQPRRRGRPPAAKASATASGRKSGVSPASKGRTAAAYDSLAEAGLQRRKRTRELEKLLNSAYDFSAGSGSAATKPGSPVWPASRSSGGGRRKVA